MGALYQTKFFDGKLSEDDVFMEYGDLCDAAVVKAEDEAYKYLEENPDSTATFQEIFDTRMTYSESFATTTYLNVSERKFESEKEADTYYFEQGGVEKWENAEAAKVKLSAESLTKYEVTPDSDGYVWAMFGILAC